MSQEIYRDLEKIGITKEFIDLPIPRNPLKLGEAAQISWTVNKHQYYFSSNKQERFQDNLGVLAVVIKQESYSIRNGLKTFTQVMNQFAIGFDDKKEKTKTPREIIGVEENSKDKEYITFKYKQKARTLHPDAGGNAEEFRKLNEAYNEIMKEQ